MKPFFTAAAAALLLCSCAVTVPPPNWSNKLPQYEHEYKAYIGEGTGSLKGQAFLTQAGGGVVRAAGETVTLDPATTIGTEWWRKAGIYYVHRNQVPPSPGFSEARRTTVADADGNFTFENLPAGKYYVRTKVTWEIGGYFPTQGGLVGKMVEVKDNEPTRVILNEMTD